ncbi:MAG: sel1 repeat family protein [Firmicutes bacterium]|nr:sel1 repeat family protein [Bacillota bacterium]
MEKKKQVLEVVCDQDVETLLATAESSGAEAWMKLGLVYRQGEGVDRDVKKAWHWMERAADAGLAGAQLCLGSWYDVGTDMGGEDFVKASQWYQKAAEQGEQMAQFSLGKLYFEQKIGKGDFAKAVEWFEKSSAQGNLYARFTLAGCLVSGMGTKIDLVRAKTLLCQVVDEVGDEKDPLVQGAHQVIEVLENYGA